MGLKLASRDLSLALGTEEVTLADLTAAYTPFATAGVRPEPRTIVRVYDSYQRTWTDMPSGAAAALSPEAAYITTQMLKDVLVTGTAKNLKKFAAQWPAAGKTGTTSDYRDAWFVGYTPQLVTGVWVGHDVPRPGGAGFTGGAVAAPIWERFMRPALAARPVLEFDRPESVITVSIDPATGYLATPECPQKREEFYAAGSEPGEYCPRHGAAPAAAAEPGAAQGPKAPASGRPEERP
jgi:membrane carboxypeptidase/penicillin-binding protein